MLLSPTSSSFGSACCSEDTGCLVFVQGEESLQLVLFDSERFLRVELAGIRWVGDRAQRLRNALRKDPSRLTSGALARRERAKQRLLGELAEALFPPLVRDFISQWSHVRVMGREYLANVHLEALPVFGAQPLGMTHALSDLPSLSVGTALATRRSSVREKSEPADVALVVGSYLDSRTTGSIPALVPDRGRERGAASIGGDPRRRVALGAHWQTRDAAVSSGPNRFEQQRSARHRSWRSELRDRVVAGDSPGSRRSRVRDLGDQRGSPPARASACHPLVLPSGRGPPRASETQARRTSVVPSSRRGPPRSCFLPIPSASWWR